MTGVTATERAELHEMTRDVARRELLPRAAALDAAEETMLADCWRQLVEIGLDRAMLSEEHQGSELGVPDLLAAIEELAVGDGGIAMCVLLCNAALATLSPERLATIPEGTRWALVPVLPAAEVTLSHGKLDGRVASALGAHCADGLVLAVQGEQPTAIAMVADTPGLELERDEAQMGLRAAPAASIEMVGVTTSSAMTATDGTGALALLRAGTAAIARGIARRAHELAFEYAQSRRQGGVAIIEHDAVSDILSAMAVRLAFRPEIAVDPTGLAVDWAQALAAKIAATDASVAITTDAVQVFGGTGYMVDSGIEKLMRDAKYCQLFPEPNWVAHGELMRSERAGRGAVKATWT
jgi:alkylation response protein AidB-like acyl-CoA dehydrogenase